MAKPEPPATTVLVVTAWEMTEPELGRRQVQAVAVEPDGRVVAFSDNGGMVRRGARRAACVTSYSAGLFDNVLAAQMEQTARQEQAGWEMTVAPFTRTLEVNAARRPDGCPNGLVGAALARLRRHVAAERRKAKAAAGVEESSEIVYSM